MAIGLASAIGLGGKRTSILEGLDEKIHKIGNEIDAKKMAEDRIKKDMEAKKNAEFQKTVDEVAKGVVFNPEGKTDEDVAELTKLGAITYAQVLKDSSNPNMSYAEKEMRKTQALQDFKNKVNFAENEYKQFDDIYNKSQDPTNNVSAMKDLLSGNYGAFETIKDEKGNEISVPTKNANPLYSKYQSTPYASIPLEERMKMGIDLKKEKDLRIATKNADLNEGLSNMFGGKDWAKEMIDKHQLASGTTDPKIIDAVVKKERNYLIGALDQDRMNPKAKLEIDKAKKLYKAEFLNQNYSEEEADQKAEDLAKLDMLNAFDQTVQRQYQIARNERDANPDNVGGGQAPTSLTSNDKWAIADPIPVDKMENTLTEQQIGDIKKEVSDKYPDPKEKAYNQTPEQYQAYLKELKSNREKIVEKRKAEETKKMFGGKDVAYVSVQSVGTSQNPTQPFAIGKGIADGVYIDQKTNEILGFGVSTIESDGSKGEFSFERATPEKVIDYKTNLGVVKGTGKNLWESKYPKKSVSSQSGSEKKAETKKAEAPKKAEAKKAKVTFTKGKVYDGYEFLGGDAKDQKNWKKIK